MENKNFPIFMKFSTDFSIKTFLYTFELLWPLFVCCKNSKIVLKVASKQQLIKNRNKSKRIKNHSANANEIKSLPSVPTQSFARRPKRIIVCCSVPGWKTKKQNETYDRTIKFYGVAL